MDQEISATLLVLSQCKDSCSAFIDKALTLSEVYKFKKSIELSKDCVQICESTIEFISRGSYHSKKISKFCAAICHKCADELRKAPYLIEAATCQELCRTCAQHCAMVS